MLCTASKRVRYTTLINVDVMAPFFTSLIWRKAKSNNVNMNLSKTRVKVVHPVSDRALTNFFQITCTERTTYTYTCTILSNATHGLGDQVVGSWINKT